MPVQKKKNNIAKTTSIMEKNAKIYIAGHHGLVGSAIWKNLQEKGYTNLIGKTHKELDLLDGVAVRRFFDEEQPEYVFLAAAFVGGIMANSIYRADFIQESPNTTKRHWREFPSQREETAVLRQHLHLSARCRTADEGRCPAHLTVGIHQ